MQGAHLICSVHSTTRFFLNWVIKVKSWLLRWLVWRCSLKFIHVLLSKCWAMESRDDILTQSGLFTQSSTKVPGKGQRFQHDLGFYKCESWSARVRAQTQLLPPLCAPRRANTVFETGTEFQMGNPGKQWNSTSQPEKSGYFVNAFTGYAL